jgi:hypothetical protein
MPFVGTRRLAPQPENFTCNTINELTPSGSWTAFTAASIAAAGLIFSAGAQNVAHAYNLGLASSEFRAVVLALASAGASILGPFCWVALFRGRGFGPRTVALVLALGCLAYAGVCSLGFVAGSRDQANSDRLAISDRYADQRAVADAARLELAGLKGQTRAVLDRRRELTKILTATAPVDAKPVQADAQAAALGFYIRTAGWQVTDAAVGTWLNLGMVLFLEMAAALSLTVAAALRPVGAPAALAPLAEAPAPAKVETPATAQARRPDEHDDDDQPPAPPRKGKAGRPRDVLPAQAIERLRAAGGKANGSIRGVGKLLGTHSKTTAHRLLHELAAAGAITMQATPRGCSVALASPWAAAPLAA